MNYNFPTINHIDDVLPHIEGRDEFKVMRKDWYTVINYVVALADTFPSPQVTGSSPKVRAERMHQNAVLRECRGLIFDSASGALISRPYHKFFNIGEKPETHPNKIDLDALHVVLEKLDGSMIRPIPVPNSASGEFRLGTKAGITDVAMNAEVWVAKHPSYADFIRMAIDHGLTPIFEWCSRKNRIVVDYPVDRLVLTAVRVNSSGGYIPHRALGNFAKDYGLDLVKVVDSDSSDIGTLVDTIRAWESDEGVVIRFDAPRATAWPGYGHMLKIKADAYVTLHRSKDAISREKNIVEVVVNDQIDDLIPILTESDASRLREFQRAFWMGVDEVASEMVDVYLDGGVGIEEQREFAQSFVHSQPKHLHPFMYGLRKGKGARDMLVDSISKCTTNQAKIDSSRWMWGNLRWNG